jgi:superfamily II DNA or RNA helicase
MKESRRAQVQIATYQAIAMRGIDWLKPDYTVLDEAHLSAFPKCIKDWVPNVTNFWQHTNRMIGLTATPRRMDKHTSLGELFLPENIVFAPTIAELIRMGHLVRPVYAVCPNAITGQMIFDPAYVLKVYGITDKCPTIVFAPSVAKAESMTDEFIRHGIEAVCVTGKTGDREKIFERFKAEEIPVLVSCQVLREGIDLPCATNLILAIDPDSHSSYVQVMGRFARPHVYKDGTKKNFFSVYDLTGSVERHGRIEELEYTADDIDLPDIEPGEVPTKLCPDPNCDIRSYISATRCRCGCEFENRRKRIVVPEGIPFSLLNQHERQHKAVYEELLLAAFERGDRPRVAREIFYNVHGYTPPILWRREFKPNKQVADWLLADGSKVSATGEWRQLALELDF